MGLKSKEWFYKVAKEHIDDVTKLAHLCNDLFNKGIAQEDSTRGHVTQAIGAVQQFLAEYPQHIPTICSAPPTESLDPDTYDEVFQDWREWFSHQSGTYGREDYGYSYDTLRGYLPKKLGGTRKGGGGGGDEFKKVLRVIAEFLDQ